MRLRTLAVVVTATLGVPAAAHGSTITVNTTADELAAGGSCSLREAINLANDGTPNTGCTEVGSQSPDRIVLPARTKHYKLARPPQSAADGNQAGDLFLFGDTVIAGAGASLS